MINNYTLKFSLLVLFIVLSSFTYPKAEQSTHVDDHFGIAVPDPYRWLEDSEDPKTFQWIDEQNAVTESFLNTIPYREEIKKRLTELLNYEKFSTPFFVGDYLLYRKNEGLQNQSTIYIQKGLQGNPEVFLDLNTLSKEGLISVNDMVPSHDDKYIALSLSHSGSDVNTIRIMDVATKCFLPDVLENCKFPAVSWKGDGFFYGCYRAGSNGRMTYYHKLGDSQDKDTLIFQDVEHPSWFYQLQTFDDERHLFLTGRKGAGDDKQDVWYKDLTQENSPIKPFYTGLKSTFHILHSFGDRLLVLTNAHAPHNRLVWVDMHHPEESHWQDVVPEQPIKLEWATVAGNKLFLCYIQDATYRLLQYDIEGHFEKELSLPALCTVSSFTGKKDLDTVFYTISTYTQPMTYYKYSVSSGVTELWKQSSLTFDPEDYVTNRVFYPSKDGTSIPLFIIHKKGLVYDGTAPTLLYGYGGFGISLTPSYEASYLILLEQGGVIAIAHIRGGGEYGQRWHDEGRCLNKQNSFDDFIAAAEYLIQNKYTSSEHLAIHGRSNGGLLVGACMTQRPDLFKVAVPGVGVMDMLRYHKFTVGYNWITEYGSSDNFVDFQNLYRYSPLHQLKEGVKYPATLVMTADRDDRVVPSHSFKFAATLQEKGSPDHRSLIRIQKNAGHGPGKPVLFYIQEQTDFWSFILYHISSFH